MSSEGSSDGSEGSEEPVHLPRADDAAHKALQDPSRTRAARRERFRRKQELASTASRETAVPEEQEPWLRRVTDAGDAALDVFRDLKARTPTRRRTFRETGLRCVF